MSCISFVRVNILSWAFPSSLLHFFFLDEKRLEGMQISGVSSTKKQKKKFTNIDNESKRKKKGLEPCFPLFFFPYFLSSSVCHVFWLIATAGVLFFNWLLLSSFPGLGLGGLGGTG